MVNPKERMEKSGRRCSKVWKRESSWTREKELRFLSLKERTQQGASGFLPENI